MVPIITSRQIGTKVPLRANANGLVRTSAEIRSRSWSFRIMSMVSGRRRLRTSATRRARRRHLGQRWRRTGLFKACARCPTRPKRQPESQRLCSGSGWPSTGSGGGQPNAKDLLRRLGTHLTKEQVRGEGSKFLRLWIDADFCW